MAPSTTRSSASSTSGPATSLAKNFLMAFIVLLLFACFMYVGGTIGTYIASGNQQKTSTVSTAVPPHSSSGHNPISSSALATTPSAPLPVASNIGKLDPKRGIGGGSPLITDFAKHGFDPNNLFGPMCRLNPSDRTDGGCQLSPFFHQGRSRVPRVQEFQCPARKSERDKLKLPSSLSGNSNHDIDAAAARLLNFKRHTSWMFDKWYDWTTEEKEGGGDNNTIKNVVNVCSKPNADSTSTTSTNDGIIRGTRARDDLYLLENFCLRPMGKVQGFWPRQPKPGTNGTPATLVPAKPSQVKPFHGSTEAFKVNGVLGHMETGTIVWLENIEPLAEKPKCLVDKKLIIFPITTHSANVGHVFHRAGSMLRVIEQAFGERAREQLDDVTVIYLVTNNGFGATSTPDANEKQNPQRYFYDILGTSWFSVFSDTLGKRHELLDHWKDFFVFDYQQHKKRFHPVDLKALDTPVCFRSAYIWQNAHHNKAAPDGFTAHGNEPGKQYSFHLFGYRGMRDVDTLNLLNRRLRQCPSPALSPRRRQANLQKPHVVMVVRSVNRRFALQPHVVNIIADYIKREFHPDATLDVIEHITLDFDEVIDRFSKADILIGMLGAGLIWLELMPPGGIVIEFNTVGYRCASVAGINVNVACDFGGAAVGAQLWHVAMANDYEPMVRLDPFAPHAGGNTDTGAGAVSVQFALGRAKCLSDHAVFNASLAVQQVPKQCRFNAAALLELAKRDVADHEGDNLGGFVQMRLPSARTSVSSADASVTRMRIMVEQRKMLAHHLDAAAFRVVPKRGDRVLLHLLVPCSAKVTSVVHEVYAWRGILRDVYHVVIAEYADGPENCPPGLPAQNEWTWSALRGNWHGTEVCRYPCKHWLPVAGYPFHLVVRSVTNEAVSALGFNESTNSILRSYVNSENGKLLTFNTDTRRITVDAGLAPVPKPPTASPPALSFAPNPAYEKKIAELEARLKELEAKVNGGGGGGESKKKK